MSGITYLTKEALEKLRSELQKMKSIDRPAASRAIAEAREKGDLKENAEYDAAKETQGLLEAKIQRLESDLANVRILEEGKERPMASLDWSQCPAVESVPGRRSGAWVFKDTRMPVATVFENLEAGSDIEEIIEQFHVTRDQVQAVLEFAARSLDAHSL